MSSQRFFTLHAACTTVSSLRAPLIAVAVAGLLAACGGNGVTAPPSVAAGGSSSGGGSTSGGPTPSTSSGTTGVATAAAQTTSDLGDTIASQTIPGLSPQVTQGLGNAVSSTSGTLNSLANAVSGGVEQIGTTSNPVGTTVAGLGSVVSSTSGVVQGLSTAVGGLGTGNLAPLSPLTTPLATVLSTTAGALNAGGVTLGNSLASAPVQQITQPISTAITPIVQTVGLVT